MLYIQHSKGRGKSSGNNDKACLGKWEPLFRYSRATYIRCRSEWSERWPTLAEAPQGKQSTGRLSCTGILLGSKLYGCRKNVPAGENPWPISETRPSSKPDTPIVVTRQANMRAKTLIYF